VIVMQMPDQAPYPQRWDFRDYPGKIKVLSDEWFEIVNYAVGEADRLNLTFSMFLCPGWSHAGGPWVTPEKGLKKLVAAEIEVNGPVLFNEILPKAPRSVGIGGGNELPSWFSLKDKQKVNVSSDFYKDIAVIALPVVGDNIVIPPDSIIDISCHMDTEGKLKWEVPEGSWKIVRLGVAAENGVNHPAPFEATGLECDRMDTAAVQQVFDGMIGRIIDEAKAKGYSSFKSFETDSYEGGFQDFGLDFQEQFLKRRGYDCTPWLPAWLNRHIPGYVIGSKDLTKRFVSDMTRTISELTAGRFNGELQNLADENSVEWITEPYFFLNVDWRLLGARSNMPGSEFWVGKPFSMIGPAPDIAALYGLQVVWAESFTAESFNSAWRNTPYELKPWGTGERS
ncbi:MAG: glycosyl hydrolase, partial [Bacteroidota bacterium]